MRQFIVALLLVVAVNLLLVAPEWWMPYTDFPYPWLATEMVMMVGLLWMLPAAWAGWVSGLLAALLLLSVALALSDLGTGLALGRPMNLLIDLPLAASVEHLLRGAIGGPLAWLTLALAGLVLIALMIALTRGLRHLAPAPGGLPLRLLGVALVGVGLSLNHYRDAWPIGLAVDSPALIRFSDQAERMRRTAHEREVFASALAASEGPVQRSMDRLDGRDVIMAFIESYGVTMLRDARYRATGEAALADLSDSLGSAGLSAVTTTLRSPVQGGQSWLAHGSALSGRWISNQIRYDLFLNASGPSLIRDFDGAGYETVAVMPAITDPWPAGQQWGYDQIHDHARIDYAGPPLNWVTMPDQYTWHYFQTAIREPAIDPLFAELALISSHAPWTPILPIVDWATVKDGSVFQRWADAGPSPGSVWSDGDRVRRHYARAVDYALRTAGEWAARDLGDGVLILLGDHQPAPLITGDEASREVPVHIIARDGALLADFLGAGFRPGLNPPEQGIGTLADLRGYLLAVFDGGQENPVSEPAPAKGAVAPSPH